MPTWEKSPKLKSGSTELSHEQKPVYPVFLWLKFGKSAGIAGLMCNDV